jgi:HK97 gp10 family phage protein
MSLLGFIEHLARATMEMHVAEHRALERAAKIVQKEAKEEIGHYQEEAGPFVHWAELAESTKEDRVRQGFAEDEPLLRTGEMRDSIEYRVVEREAVVGSDSPIAEYQELGTTHIPPRSFLGGAAFRKAEEVAKIVGAAPVIALVGEQVIGGRLGISPED